MLWSELAICKIHEESPLAPATWPSHPHVGLGTRPGSFFPREEDGGWAEDSLLICLCRDLDPHMQRAPGSTRARGKEAPSLMGLPEPGSRWLPRGPWAARAVGSGERLLGTEEVNVHLLPNVNVSR